MAQRPSIFPFVDRLTTNVDPDYVMSPLQFTGFQPGDVIPSKTHNTLWLLGALWQNYLDYGVVHTTDAVDTITPQRWSPTQLSYTVGDSVDVVGASVNTYATYMIGGFRIEIDDGLLRMPGASPLLVPGATTPGRIWVYLNYAIISDPGQPVASVRVESVGPGAPAAPAAGEMPLVGVDIDAAGVITGNVYDGGDPDYGLRYSSTIPVEFPAETTITELICGGSASGATPLTVVPVTGGSANSVVVTGDSNVPAMRIDGQNALAIQAVGNDVVIEATTASVAANAIFGSATLGAGVAGDATGGSGVTGTATTGVGVTGSSTAGVGVIGTGGGTFPGVSGTGGASGHGVVGLGGATIGDGVRGTAQAASSAGARGIGADFPTSSGVLGLATNVGAYGVEGQSAASGSTAGAGVRGVGLGDASAIYALAADGYGALIASDNTSPTRTALRLAPQNADATTASSGDIEFHSGRDTLRVCTSSGFKSVHLSTRGFVRAVSTAASGGPIAGSVTTANIVMALEELGTVYLFASGSLLFSVDAGQCTIDLLDVTAGVTISSQIELGPDDDGGAGVNQRSFSIAGVYLPPNASSRTYGVRISATTGTITYSNVILKGEGTF